MADTNWHWINAVNPAGPHRNRKRGSLDRRLGSFWRKREARVIEPVFDGEGNLYAFDGKSERAPVRGKLIDSTDDELVSQDSKRVNGRKPEGLEVGPDGTMRLVY